MIHTLGLIFSPFKIISIILVGIVIGILVIVFMNILMGTYLLISSSNEGAK